jgi:hypothetical protein
LIQEKETERREESLKYESYPAPPSMYPQLSLEDPIGSVTVVSSTPSPTNTPSTSSSFSQLVKKSAWDKRFPSTTQPNSDNNIPQSKTNYSVNNNNTNNNNINNNNMKNATNVNSNEKQNDESTPSVSSSFNSLLNKKKKDSKNNLILF